LCSAVRRTSCKTLPQILEFQWTEKTAPVVATIGFLQSSMAKRCFDEQWARDYSCAKYQDRAPQDTPPVGAQPCPLNGDPEPQQPKPGCPLGKKKRKRHVAETDPAKARKVVKGWFDSIAVAQSRITLNGANLRQPRSRHQMRAMSGSADASGSELLAVAVATIMQLPDGTIYVASQNVPNLKQPEGLAATVHAMGLRFPKDGKVKFRGNPT